MKSRTEVRNSDTQIADRVKIHSHPSDLKITDMRTAKLRGSHLIRIDTNQGISGYGEVRDGGSKTYALMLKSRILGENPCNVDKIFRKIKQFGHHARQAGGVCGIEMALMDLAGRAYGVPAYQLAGGKFRDKILCYCDTPNEKEGKEEDRRYGSGKRDRHGAAHGDVARGGAGGSALRGGQREFSGAGESFG
jgi:L-alanine-DL-glutamate epimerase-like enolase superfamily enzyme